MSLKKLRSTNTSFVLCRRSAAGGKLQNINVDNRINQI